MIIRRVARVWRGKTRRCCDHGRVGDEMRFLVVSVIVVVAAIT